MDKRRRKVLWGALAGVVVTMLFPPFYEHPGGNLHKVWRSGFDFILFREFGATVDIQLLLTEWLAIAIVCGILWTLSRDANTLGIIERLLLIAERKAAAKKDRGG